MHDEIYKTVVVLITVNYVHDDDDLAADSTAKALLAAMKKKGWYKVRLLGATGEPYNDENSPVDDFERAAVKKLKVDKDCVDQVESRGDSSPGCAEEMHDVPRQQQAGEEGRADRCIGLHDSDTVKRAGMTHITCADSHILHTSCGIIPGKSSLRVQG